MPVRFRQNGGTHGFQHAVKIQPLQGDFIRGVQAGLQLPICRQTDPVALRAEVGAHRADQTDVPLCTGKAVQLGDTAVGRNRREFGETFRHRRVRDEGFGAEVSAVVHGHQFNKTDVHRILPGQPGKGGEIQLTDALKVLAKEDFVYAYDFEGQRYDLGDKLGFLKATVEFVTKSFYKAANNYQYERFGIPTWKELESIECNVAGLYTGIRMYKNGVWDDLGFLQKDIPFEKKYDMNVPFATYNLLAFQATAGAEYLFKGELTGNNDAALNTVDEWTPFTNSFTANVDVTELLEALDGCAHIGGYLYLATPQGNGKYSWKAWDSESDGLTGLKMAPMQAFILYNSDGVEEASVLNYKSMVYDPATGGAGAPRRAKVYDYTAKLSIVVESADGASDQVVIRESPNSRRNAVKYMNDDVNIYAHGVDNTLSIASSDDVENTYFGFSTVEGGSFTIRFINVSGRQFDFVDIETNERVAVEEGKTYSFSTTANTVADYRFKIVEREGIATAVDAINAEKTNKGIYTIMGQYVGEMNIWNSLPAGVYVVDGEKRVK